MKYAWPIIMSLAVMASTLTAGPKLEISEDAWFQPAFLGQVHYQFNDNAADEEDFFLRRGRIILKGQMADGVKFFMETDNDNAGKSGRSAVSTDIQDAWLDVRVLNAEAATLWLQGGLILLPFSFENRSSAASLLGIDYNAETIKFVNSFVWRDYGAELHGLLGKRVEVRAGVFDGYDVAGSAKNPEAPLRYTGHVGVNVIGDALNGGWFYSQNRLGKMQYLAVGAGVDSQSDATTNAMGTVDSEAWVVDLQSSFSLGENAALLVNAAYYDWDNAAFDGNTAFVEAGVKVGKVMPTAKWSLQDPERGDEAEDLTAGIHYFIKGQNARLGVEYTWGDTDSTDERILLGIQFLL